MCSGDFTPDDADLAAPDGLLCSVDVCDAFSEVESRVFCRVNTLYFDERGVWVCVAFASLMGEVLSLNI